MTKITGAKITGAKIKHEFTFLSVPGLQFLFDPSKGITKNGSNQIQYYRDVATNRVLIQSINSTKPTLITGEGSFPAVRIAGGQRMTAESLSEFNFLHQGHKIAVFTIIKPLADSDNQENVILGTAINSTSAIGFHIILDDRDSFSRVNAIHSSIKKGVGPSGYAGVLTNNSTENLTDIRFVQACFRGARTGGDFEQYINKTLVGGGEISGTPSSGNPTAKFALGNPTLGGPSNHDNYFFVGYDWNDATDSEFESRRLMVESLIYQKFSTILPE